MIWKYQPGLNVQIMGSSKEEFNYRNKTNYTFNLSNAQLDQFTFKIAGLDHVKMIQYINMVTNRDYRISTGTYSVHDIFIKNNNLNQYQICLAISLSSSHESHLKETIKFIFAIIKKMTSDLDINVVSGYYYIYDAKIPLKEKEFHHFCNKHS